MTEDHYIAALEAKNRELHAVNEHLRETLARVEALRDKWRLVDLPTSDPSCPPIVFSHTAAALLLTRALAWQDDQ